MSLGIHQNQTNKAALYPRIDHFAHNDSDVKVDTSGFRFC